MNIVNMLRENADKSPGKVLLIFEGREMTYAEFLGQVNRLANGLDSLRIRKDDKVGLLMSNRVEYLMSYYAIATIGAVAVPLNYAFTAYELAYHLNNADAVSIISEPALLPNLRKAQPNVPKLKSIISTSEQDDPNVPSLIRNHSASRSITPRMPDDIMHLIILGNDRFSQRSDDYAWKYPLDGKRAQSFLWRKAGRPVHCGAPSFPRLWEITDFSCSGKHGGPQSF